jgi:hypothetical protein
MGRNNKKKETTKEPKDPQKLKVIHTILDHTLNKCDVIGPRRQGIPEEEL